MKFATKEDTESIEEEKTLVCGSVAARYPGC